jgi:hypothetical protein
MAEPVGRVHFAGEHCCRPFNGMVNGAMWSGVRAGQEVHEALGGAAVSCDLTQLVALAATGLYTPRPWPHEAATAYRLDRACAAPDIEVAYREWKTAANFQNN